MSTVIVGVTPDTSELSLVSGDFYTYSAYNPEFFNDTIGAFDTPGSLQYLWQGTQILVTGALSPPNGSSEIMPISSYSVDGSKAYTYQGAIPETTVFDVTYFISDVYQNESHILEITILNATYNSHYLISTFSVASGISLGTPSVTNSTSSSSSTSTSPTSSPASSGTAATGNISSGSSTPTGAIAGGVVGGVAVLVLAVLAFFWWRKHNRKPRPHSGNIEESAFFVDTHGGAASPPLMTAHLSTGSASFTNPTSIVSPLQGLATSQSDEGTPRTSLERRLRKGHTPPPLPPAPSELSPTSDTNTPMAVEDAVDSGFRFGRRETPSILAAPQILPPAYTQD